MKEEKNDKENCVCAFEGEGGVEPEGTEELTFSEKEAGKESKPHQRLEGSGLWECPAVAKCVNVVTVDKGMLCCGHCLSYIRDREGNKIPFSLKELFGLEYKEGLGRVLGEEIK